MAQLLQHLRKWPELIPLVGLVGVAAFGASVFGVYSFYQKSDVHLMKHTHIPPHELVDPTKSQKLYTIKKGGYRENAELETLRKEIGVYKAK